MFHGDQRTITHIAPNQHFCVIDVLNGTLLYQGGVVWLLGSEIGAYWTHKDTLRFAMSFTNRKPMISIYELQLASTPPLYVLSSFSVPIQSPHFSFSPISFHASFSTDGKVVVFDLQDSKLLLQVETTQEFPPPGQFSSDGQLFVCQTSERRMCIWKNTPTGYVPWGSLRPRSSFKEFSWSPTSTSILCWGPEGIQLLCPDNHLSPLIPNEPELSYLPGDHLVAYSANGTHIAATKQRSDAVTVLNHLHGTPQQFTNTGMQILDIRIVGTTVFAVDMYKLVGWDLEAGGTTHVSHGARRMIVNKPLAIDPNAKSLALSHNCSQVAFMVGTDVFLHDIETWECVFKREVEDCEHRKIRFNPAGNLLGFIGKDAWSFENICRPTGKFEDLWWELGLSSPHGYKLGSHSEWVTDSRGKKILWLPPNLREMQLEVKWDGNFMALLSLYLPEPVIVEFQP